MGSGAGAGMQSSACMDCGSVLMRRVSGGLGPACRPRIQAGRPGFLDTEGWKGQCPPPPLPPGPGLGNKGSRVTDTSALCPEPSWAPQRGQGSTGNWEEPPCPSQRRSMVGRQLANGQLQVDEEGWVGDAGRTQPGRVHQKHQARVLTRRKDKSTGRGLGGSRGEPAASPATLLWKPAWKKPLLC